MRVRYKGKQRPAKRRRENDNKGFIVSNFGLFCIYLRYSNVKYYFLSFLLCVREIFYARRITYSRFGRNYQMDSPKVYSNLKSTMEFIIPHYFMNFHAFIVLVYMFVLIKFYATTNRFFYFLYF